MQQKSAEINQEGAHSLLLLATNPTSLDTQLGSTHVGYAGDEQLYIPGISIPGLNKSFHVPIIGDNESFSLLVERPQKLDAAFFKRVTFTGMLVAESVVFKVGVDSNMIDNEIDEAFDEYAGQWGGFLRSVVELSFENLEKSEDVKMRRSAELYTFENEREWEAVGLILTQGFASAHDIVMLSRLGSLSALVHSVQKELPNTESH